jgi:D-glycero-alpha-D-manno-heptose-7-phosphate kinase
LATTIDKYTTITVHRLTQFSDHCLRIHYSQVESVPRRDDVQHPSARECLRLLGIDRGLEIHYVSDLPARTGLGSSSAATVGLLMALHAFKGQMVSREQVASEALMVEQGMIPGNHVGSQDQYACALGGLRHLRFESTGAIAAEPVPLAPERLRALEERLMLLYTGVQRNAHEVLDEQIEKTESGANVRDLDRLKELVDTGLEVLTGDGPLDPFGEVLHEGWLLKRGLSSRIASDEIDAFYARARKAGAIGGKLLGAGSGGFFLLFVDPGKRASVRRELRGFREAKFSFENSGTRVIFYRP